MSNYALANEEDVIDAPSRNGSGPTVEEVELEEIGALFAADMPEERIDIPGYPGCFVLLKPMDADAYSNYLQKGQSVQIQGGKIQQANPDLNVTLHVAEQELFLITHTVVDYGLMRQAAVVNGDRPGQTAAVSIVPPQGVNRNERLKAMESTFKAVSPQFRRWLVRHCRRVNGFTEAQAG
jgi:hypothetical protein